jgi:hypothetical protein
VKAVQIVVQEERMACSHTDFPTRTSLRSCVAAGSNKDYAITQSLLHREQGEYQCEQAAPGAKAPPRHIVMNRRCSLWKAPGTLEGLRDRF